MPIIEQPNLTVIRKTGAIPLLPINEIREKILGKSYDLTVIFCTKEESKNLNGSYRDKSYPTNILSFPLSEKEGEIYISLSTARKDAKKFEMSYRKFLHLLMVHGALHLKGHDHGSTMEELEQRHLSKFFRG